MIPPPHIKIVIMSATFSQSYMLLNFSLQKALKKFTKCDKLRLKLMLINRNRPRYVRLLSKLKLDCWVIADDLSDLNSGIKSEKFSRAKLKMFIFSRGKIFSFQIRWENESRHFFVFHPYHRWLLLWNVSRTEWLFVQLLVP